MKTTGGDIIAQMLKAEGVDTVFGIIDGTYHALVASLKKHNIRLITPRHETSALHMAAAYARLTGKLGVAMASNGPGVANALPGIAVENAEGNRVLFISSSRRTGIAYPDRGGTYQYFNQVGVIKPMAKYSATAHIPGRVQEIMKRALRSSYSGRPGVVHVDVPENIMNGKQEYPAPDAPSSYRRQHLLQAPDDVIEQAAVWLRKAKYPAIHAGSGVLHSQCYQQLQQIAEKLLAPVVTSWAARGVLDERLDYVVPMPYVELTNSIRNEADVILVLGSRISETDWWGKAPYWAKKGQKVIQVDIDDYVLGNTRTVDLPVLNEIGDFLTRLNYLLPDELNKAKLAKRQKNIKSVVQDKKKERKALDKNLKSTGSPMNPAHVAAAAREIFEDDAIAVFDGGNTTVWGNFYHEVRVPNSQLSTYKFGMLGAGVAQALGAKAAFKDRQVYCITGDGAFGFHPQEIETAVRNNLPVVYLVVTDQQWGMVKMTQQFVTKPLKTMIKKSLGPEETINADLNEIEYNKLAQSMGAYGDRVSSADQLRPALEKAIASNIPAVIHVDVDPVKHMWAPGLMHFKDMHKEPKG